MPLLPDFYFATMYCGSIPHLANILWHVFGNSPSRGDTEKIYSAFGQEKYSFCTDKVSVTSFDVKKWGDLLRSVLNIKFGVKTKYH